MKTFPGILLIICTASLNAQEKEEVEQRINFDDVPQKAVEWLDDAYEKPRRTKWYYEETSGLKSYEAKFKWNDHIHSVEFNTAGVVQDIEITITWHDLPEIVQQAMSTYLDSAFFKHSVQKIQKQWTGDPDDLEDLMDEDEYEGVIIRYEIEYYGKNESHDSLWEGLFDSEGILLHERKIKLRPTNNLNF